MKKHIIVVATVLAALTLAGCSSGGGQTVAVGEQESEPTPTETKQTPVENVDKTWTFDYQGAKGSFDLQGDPSNADVAALEAARASVNGQAVMLIPVELDNTNGSTDLNMYGMTIVTKDGQQIDSTPLSDVLAGWRDAAGEDVDKYNAIVDIENEQGSFLLAPGAKGTALVAFSEPVTSAWRVTVMPAGGFDQVEAAAS